MPGYILGHLDILLIERNMLMRQVLKDVMRQLGVGTVRMASNHELAQEVVTERCPDLVITDWSPDFDGLGFVRTIRSLKDHPAAFVPIIVLSAFAEEHHVFAARDAGVHEFLAKPITAHSLYKRIVTVIEKERYFVRVPCYFGPDRRRRRIAWQGPERRVNPGPPTMVDGTKALAEQRAAEQNSRTNPASRRFRPVIGIDAG